jgi:hypothetical protein
MLSATVAASRSPIVYFEEEPGRRSAAKLLAKDEARRIAVISPSCPGSLQKP